MTIRKRCPGRPFCILNPLDIGGLSKSFLSIVPTHFFRIEAGSKRRFVVVEDKYINKPCFSFSFYCVWECIHVCTHMCYGGYVWRSVVNVRMLFFITLSHFFFGGGRWSISVILRLPVLDNVVFPIQRDLPVSDSQHWVSGTQTTTPGFLCGTEDPVSGPPACEGLRHFTMELSSQPHKTYFLSKDFVLGHDLWFLQGTSISHLQ